jgi:hypothetical protein
MNNFANFSLFLMEENNSSSAKNHSKFGNVGWETLFETIYYEKQI